MKAHSPDLVLLSTVKVSSLYKAEACAVPLALAGRSGDEHGRASPSVASVTLVRTQPTLINRILRRLVGLPAKPLLVLIWIYQRAISPSLPAMFGPTCSCRYYPTCSHYAAEALRTHGVLLGMFFAARRLLRCTPFHSGGIDLVPAPGVLRRVCQRVRTTQVSV